MNFGRTRPHSGLAAGVTTPAYTGGPHDGITGQSGCAWSGGPVRLRPLAPGVVPVAVDRLPGVEPRDLDAERRCGVADDRPVGLGTYGGVGTGGDQPALLRP